jgi:hypothetical protein
VADSYRLTFNEDGTGITSGINPYEESRFETDITWKIEDGECHITGDKDDDGDDTVFYLIDSLRFDLYFNFMPWTIEELTADTLVLSANVEVFGPTDTDDYSSTAVYRYTFEKVEQ